MMIIIRPELQLATDLSTYSACRHATLLEREAKWRHGTRERPHLRAPALERPRHEAACRARHSAHPLRNSVDVLAVDEAGQVSLANAVLADKQWSLATLLLVAGSVGVAMSGPQGTATWQVHLERSVRAASDHLGAHTTARRRGRAVSRLCELRVPSGRATDSSAALTAHAGGLAGRASGPEPTERR